MKLVDFHPEVILAVTDKSDGNIDYRFGGKRQVDNNRKKIFEQINSHPSQLVEAEQIHYTRILHLYEENTKMWKGMSVTGVDGFVTDQKDLTLMMRVADCVTVVMYDPEHKALGISHAGWKGVDQGVHLESLRMMEKTYKTEAKQLHVWLGPCAQKCCYSHAEKPSQEDKEEWKSYVEKTKGHWCVDMVGFLTQSFNQNGVLKKNIKSSNECTIESPHYFSHRGAQSNEEDLGRFAVIAQLK